MQLGAEKSGSYGSHGASGPSRWLKLAILPPCAMAPARDSAIIPAAFVPVCSAVVTSKPGARVGQWASRRRRAQLLQLPSSDLKINYMCPVYAKKKIL